jgi:hypothetical protein
MSGTYMLETDDSQTQDAVCVACARGFYTSTTNQRACTAWTECSSSQWSPTPSASRDRNCQVRTYVSLRFGWLAGVCVCVGGGGAFEQVDSAAFNTPPANTVAHNAGLPRSSDRQAVSTCPPPQAILVQATPSTDAQCTVGSGCNANQFSAEYDATTQVCRAVSVCDTNSQYVLLIHAFLFCVFHCMHGLYTATSCVDHACIQRHTCENASSRHLLVNQVCVARMLMC